MKSGKFLFIAIIFLVSLVCISAVSAADEAVNDVIADTNDETVLQESIDDEILADSQNDELEETDDKALGDGEEGSELIYPDFTGLSDFINSGEDIIELSTDFVYDDEDDPIGINITHNVTIYGNGHTIDGKNKSRIFIVPNDIFVVFKDINFKNAYLEPKEKGAAIWLDLLGEAQAINCNFTNNEAFSGGATVGVDAINCTFINNTALDGGAMFGGSAVNCTFINNEGTAGGAISCADAINCTFINNTAGGSGGAIYSGDAINCNFINNTAGYMGGAIRDCEAINCTFTQNSAQYGGAISEGKVVNCILTKNSASYQGGAMYDCEAINCTFTQNSAQYGGAMYYGHATNCTFKFNTATKSGNDAYEVITDNTCRFIKSTKITASAVTAIYNNNKYLVITLKDSEGKVLSGLYVSVTLSGAKKYKTNSNGQIKINVGKLVPKTYTAKISFAATGNYLASSTTAKVTVKKATPKLTANAKTFRVGLKTKLYKVTLKNNKSKLLKKVKLTLRVNKKTFKATTNSKGVATFKITNLKKKGKFTATIKYAGSKYYNKVTKKPVITVKK
ncbi:MAG: hypothetical protein VZR33_08570 [Methanosphaera sp.]|nr:hypothetical protein [Methanosphaera sp.]